MAHNPSAPQDTISQAMKVAKLYGPQYSEAGTRNVTFYESARFYKLKLSHPQAAEYLHLLKQALKKHEPLMITFTQRAGEQSATILKVEKYRSG